MAAGTDGTWHQGHRVPRAVPPWEMGKYRWVVPVQPLLLAHVRMCWKLGWMSHSWEVAGTPVPPGWHRLMGSVDIRDICLCKQGWWICSRESRAAWPQARANSERMRAQQSSDSPGQAQAVPSGAVLDA